MQGDAEIAMNAHTNEIASPYPWQQTVWDRLRAQHQQQRLPHALLLIEPGGCGHSRLALALAQYLLCKQPQATACGQCKTCLLLAQDNHPDFVRIEPESAGKAIRVDQIRKLVDFAAASAQQGGYRVVLLEPAERMNVNAANALLKVLEEPGEDSLFLLLSERPGRVLPTVRSRCQQLRLVPPAEAEALSWLREALPAEADARLLLRLAGGAPLAALELQAHEGQAVRAQRLDALAQVIRRQQSVSEVAEHWGREELLPLLEWLQRLVADLLRLRLGACETAQRNPDAQELLERLQPLSNPQKLFEFRDKMQDYRENIMRGTNPNQQLLWEDLLIAWRDLFKRSNRKAG